MKNLFDDKRAIVISPWSIVFTVGFLLSLVFLFYIKAILINLFLAVILMAALAPAMRLMQRRLRFPKVLAILILYLFVITFLVVLFGVIIPPLFAEIPRLITALQNLPPLPEFVSVLGFQISLAQINTYVGDFFGSLLQNSFGTAYNLVVDTVVAIFSLFTTLVMAAYLLVDRDKLHRKIGWLTNKKEHFEMAKKYLDDLEVQLGGWVRGQLFLMFSIGLVTYLGLTVLGIPYAVPLALLAGLFEILPNIGPTVSAIPGIVIAFAMNPTMGVIVLIFYIIIQQLENNIIVPKIMMDAVDVNPLATIILVLIGFKVGGVLGALLSVPIYIMLRSAYSLFLRHTRGSDVSPEKEA